MQKDLVLIANSAGEISAFVKPLAKKIKSLSKDIALTLVLVPCQYSTGLEKQFAEQINCFDQILTVKEYKKWIFFNQLPHKTHFGTNGIVLFLGGDVLHALLTARKLKYKTMAYTENLPPIKKWVEKFMVPDEDTFEKLKAQKIPESKIKVVGNLMADSLEEQDPNEILKKTPFNKDQPIVTFMPGSRIFQINYLIPFYTKILEKIAEKTPELQTVLSLSPFSKIEQIKNAAQSPSKVTQEGKYFYLNYKNGKTLISQENTALISDLAITIPGTNTAQLAVQGTPMLVVFPLDKPEGIPLEGIAHYISLIPFFGILLKKHLANQVMKKYDFFALPNIKAKSKIVPEMVGKIAPEAVVAKIEELLADKKTQAETRIKLKISLGKPGASHKIAEIILRELDKE